MVKVPLHSSPRKYTSLWVSKVHDTRACPFLAQHPSSPSRTAGPDNSKQWYVPLPGLLSRRATCWLTYHLPWPGAYKSKGKVSAWQVLSWGCCEEPLPCLPFAFQGLLTKLGTCGSCHSILCLPQPRGVPLCPCPLRRTFLLDGGLPGSGLASSEVIMSAID